MRINESILSSNEFPFLMDTKAKTGVVGRRVIIPNYYLQTELTIMPVKDWKFQER